jgi:GNAT superfamily N-acetyltransferase
MLPRSIGYFSQGRQISAVASSAVVRARLDESTPMNDELNIRPTTQADVAAIADIAEATELFPAHMLGDMISGYFDRTKVDIWLTATIGDQPVGFGFCEPERMTSGTWNLLAIGITPDRQRQGIGASLVRHLEGLLSDAGHRVLLVETIGTPEFARTRSFYLLNGFAEEARIREFYDAGADKVVFWKHL